MAGAFDTLAKALHGETYDAVAKVLNATNDKDREDAMKATYDALQREIKEKHSEADSGLLNSQGINKASITGGASLAGDTTLAGGQKGNTAAGGQLKDDPTSLTHFTPVKSEYSDVYTDLDALLSSFGTGNITIGQIMMLLLSIALTTRNISFMATKDFAMDQDLTQKAKQLQQFLNDLGIDMKSNVKKGKTGDADLYDYLNGVINDKTVPESDLKVKYKAYMKTFCPDFDWSKGDSGVDFAKQLNGCMATLDAKIQLRGVKNGTVGLFEVDEEGKIIIPCDTTTGVPDGVKLNNRIHAIGTVVDQIGTIETADKARVEAAQQVFQAANSMLSSFINMLNSLYRGN
jgi:hypothetical protein